MGDRQLPVAQVTRFSQRLSTAQRDGRCNIGAVLALTLPSLVFLRFLRELIPELVRVFLREIRQGPRWASNDSRQIVKNFVRFHRGSIR
jgi:hypothetical protein